MSLRDAVERAFAADGPLRNAVDAYVPRPGQTQMALEVASTLDEGGVLVVEAGTGVGKTFAYLIPALLSGERVLLSTATKALQDQLFQRDIPRLMAVLGIAVRVALLKGRGSYLCLHRMAQARDALPARDMRSIQSLAQVELWAQTTRSGDLAELVHLEDGSPVIPLVTSTRDNCLGAKCPQAQACHVNLARREAMAADVVVVNHHLFFADLNVRESGVAELLPTVRSVVFDEAHQLSEIGVQFMGQQFSTGQLASFSTELFKVSQQHARGFAPWDELVHELQRAGQALHAAGGARAGRRRWRGAAPEGMEPAEWEAVVCMLRDAMEAVQRALAAVAEVSPELSALHARAQHLTSSLELFLAPVEPGYVRWMDTGNQVRLVHSPLDIADTMRDRVLNPESPTGRKSWIFTSATLGHDASLGWFLQSCGLEGARVLQVPSPFDYPSQAALYIPQDMPKPGDVTHTQAVAQLVAEGAHMLGGRTMVLTTTLRAMRSIGEALRDIFGLAGGMDVLVQGEASKWELVERFCQAERVGGAACILVASASFWEGIDIPGEALQLLVIDKLPFAPPDDPLVQARSDQLEASGRSPFKDLHVPQAAVALKQGAGRLIRRETDRGILVVCDVRLRQMGYAKKLLAALPPMRRLDSKDQWLEALTDLTRPSTMDPQRFSNPW